ncbi:MAG: hypothetical protein ACM3N0_01935 [Chloroflexota bacterium]
MSPPRICPPPPDCPLYEQRLGYGPDEPLRRAILTERAVPGLTALIRAEAPAALPVEPDEAKPLPPPLALPTRPALPAPEPVPLSVLNQLQKETS